ncbi:MAG: hypothetical protein EP298_06910 [Gammaproteobacteria bacterium]|nr:MAG: hypothetical protein EP298_06910 [Gammaproteobacteria bacterium]UTW42963.1 hypothetical protein KFE69_02145 [bacterium SCSIO 12844]
MNNIITTIYYTLAYTPWWVYVLFIYLLFIGIKASKPSHKPISKLAIIPAIFLILSIESLINQTNLHGINLLAYAIALVIGIIIGFIIACFIGAQATKENNKYIIILPGSWLTLILILIIFISKYYFGFKVGDNPNLIHNLYFTITMLSVYGVTAGLFIGRFIFYLMRIYQYRKRETS